MRQSRRRSPCARWPTLAGGPAPGADGLPARYGRWSRAERAGEGHPAHRERRAYVSSASPPPGRCARTGRGRRTSTPWSSGRWRSAGRASASRSTTTSGGRGRMGSGRGSRRSSRRCRWGMSASSSPSRPAAGAHNADWYLARSGDRVGALLADTDGVFDPRDYNDRLLLGLRELTRRSCTCAAADGRRGARGAGQLSPAPADRRLPDGRVVKDPDRQVQHAIELSCRRDAHSATACSSPPPDQRTARRSSRRPSEAASTTSCATPPRPRLRPPHRRPGRRPGNGATAAQGDGRVDRHPPRRVSCVPRLGGSWPSGADERHASATPAARAAPPASVLRSARTGRRGRQMAPSTNPRPATAATPSATSSRADVPAPGRGLHRGRRRRRLFQALARRSWTCWTRC